MVAFSVITLRRRSRRFIADALCGKRRRTSTKNSGTKDRQHGGGDHPAHHSGADRMLAAGTGAVLVAIGSTPKMNASEVIRMVGAGADGKPTAWR